MAQVGDYTDIGDYRYTIIETSPNRYVSAKVIDNTKRMYSDINGSVTIDGDLYTLIDMSETFANCESLRYFSNDAFTIPSSVTNMSHTFYECRDLTHLPTGFTISSGVTNMSGTFTNCIRLKDLGKSFTIPSGVTDMSETFYGCESLEELPGRLTIPSGVADMSFTFYDCSGLTSLPSGFTIPEGVTDIYNTFNACRSLTSLPSGFTIPSGVEYMSNTFRNCSSLEGNILFEPDHVYTGQYENIFTGTTKPIYLIDNGSQSTIAAASYIADLFNNVYMARDVNTAPTLSVNTTRVDSLGDTTENQLGKYVYINSSINIYEDRYPGTEYSSIAFTMDGSSITPTVVTPPSGSGMLTYEGWYDTDDLQSHNFTVQVTDSLNHASSIMSFIFPGSVPTMDVMNGGHGLSLGMICPNDGFHCNWDATFYKNFKARQAPGIIKMYAGSSAPDGWLLCDGSAVSRTDYSLLYAVIGTTYGAGDGSTTFNIPDLRGRFPVGAGVNYNIGSTGGSEDSIIPYHNHHVDAISSGAQWASLTGSAKALGWSTATASGIISITSPTNDRTASSGKNFGHRYYNIDASHAHTVAAHDTNYAGTSGEEVGGNMPPYVGVNYIISTGEPSEWSGDSSDTIVRGVLVDGQSVVNGQGIAEVCETETNGIWTYRKWPNGKLEAWGTKTGTLSNYSTWNNMNGYYFSAVPTPITMIDQNYKVFGDWMIGSGFAWHATTLSKSTTSFNIYALSSATGSQSCYVDMYLYGRWK